MKLEKRLIEKSIEAFIMGIELFNKPTIKYRVEGFSFFICNAWELMLKSYIIKKFGEKKIYFEDNPERTISLENCVKLVFTNKKDPLRENLEDIIELRNTSTHFITEEYEMIYVPLFQACLFNFERKMFEFHNIDINNYVAYNFLNLSISAKQASDAQIRQKYPSEISNRLISKRDEIEIQESSRNENYAITIEHRVFITKNKDDADSIYAIDKNSEDVIGYIREVKDPSQTHKYTTSKVISLINRRIAKEKIEVSYTNGKGTFTTYDFQNFIKYFKIKENPDYCYEDNLYPQKRYSYSMKVVDFIVGEIKKDPDNILHNLKNTQKKR